MADEPSYNITALQRGLRLLQFFSESPSAKPARRLRHLVPRAWPLQSESPSTWGARKTINLGANCYRGKVESQRRELRPGVLKLVVRHAQILLRAINLRIGVMVLAIGCFTASSLGWASSTVTHAPCRAQSTTFEGWKAEELSNDWVRLTIVPQIGGRLMQVTFNNHAYLFVNPKYKGKYFPPSDAAKTGQWFNYGGDKLWPLPEGHHDEQHWAGPISDALDDGEYKFSIVSQGATCAIHLEGPADSVTGLQYSREISIGNESPQISFKAVMKNVTGHPIRWSMQSVTQYDTADARDPVKYNHDFWAFAPINPHSAYIDGYRVRDGLADDPSFEVTDGLFTLHWLYLENEVWIDSDGGWIAIVDNRSKYAMIEQFEYVLNAEYSGKASVIFYKNGAALELDENGMPTLRSANWQEAPYYMEAEINSPMINLNPGASYAMDSRWFPTRGDKELKAVTSAGVVNRPLAASLTLQGLKVSGVFGVFFPGTLSAHVFDLRGVEIAVVELQTVDPLNEVELNQTVRVADGADRISVHLKDQQGVDRGSLGEAKITKGKTIS